jgi:hypothetical protein
MKTGSFRTFRDGPGRVSIARWAPRGHPKAFHIFSPLAPGPWSRVMTGRGNGVAAALDPQQTYDRLHELAGAAEPILLCWGVPPRPCLREWSGQSAQTRGQHRQDHVRHERDPLSDGET